MKKFCLFVAAIILSGCAFFAPMFLISCGPTARELEEKRLQDSVSIVNEVIRNSGSIVSDVDVASVRCIYDEKTQISFTLVVLTDGSKFVFPTEKRGETLNRKN